MAATPFCAFPGAFFVTSLDHPPLSPAHLAALLPILLVALVLAPLAGKVVQVAASRLMQRMQQQWSAAAQELREMEEAPEPPPATRLSQRALLLLLIAASATIIAATGLQHGWSTTAGLHLLISMLLLTGAAVDIQEGLLPDSITLSALWVALLAAAYGLNPEVTATQSIMGAALGYAGFWSVSRIVLLLTGAEGLGQGDVKLIAAIGAWQGALALMPVVFIAAVSGLLLAGVLHQLGRKHEKGHISFGPSLVIGALVNSMLPAGLLLP